ncbi:MAG: proline racemase family protein [Candidatus Neomarinimicrobiota bacterium]
MDISKINIYDWQPSENMLCINTIDAHTCGEPLRVIFNGFPKLRGDTILEKRRYAQENYNSIRRSLMWEPRGHADMYGCIITKAVSSEADFGVLFIHNEGFSTMCGHGIIAVTTVMLECGFMSMESPEVKIKIDTPAGMVTAYARVKNNKVESVYFHNVPSFVYQLNKEVVLEGIGKIKYDIAFGGAFYAIINAEEVGIQLIPENNKQIINLGMKIKKAIIAETEFQHPFEDELNYLYGTIFIGPPHSTRADGRNVCIFAEGELDRSPTGTGVSARLALHHAKSEIKKSESMVIESIIGSTFRGSIKEVTKFGEYNAVITEVEGSAYITGRNEFFIDPNDPLKNGFILR